MPGTRTLRRALYTSGRTALLIVDAYNDFVSDGGKLWPQIRTVAEAVNLLAHLCAVAAAARRGGLVVVYVPHLRWTEGAYDGWHYPGPGQLAGDRDALFADGTWGGEWHPDLAPQTGDIIVQPHWGQSGFAGTDLDLELKQRGIEKIILIGLAANTCVEATARHGAELGYHVTLVRDATAAASREAMVSAHEINGPTFAHAIMTTETLIACLRAR